MDRIIEKVNQMQGEHAKEVQDICANISDHCAIICGESTSDTALYELLTGPAALSVWKTLEKSTHKLLWFDIKHECDKSVYPCNAPEVWKMISTKQVLYVRIQNYYIVSYNDEVYVYTR